MRSNSPFRQDKCATGWAALEAGYKDKEEYKKEKNEYHCNQNIKLYYKTLKKIAAKLGKLKKQKKEGFLKVNHYLLQSQKINNEIF